MPHDTSRSVIGVAALALFAAVLAWLLGSSGGGHHEPPTRPPTSSDVGLATRYTEAVLQKADLAEANRLLVVPDGIGVRSQVSFMSGHGDVKLGAPTGSGSTVRFPIEHLVVGDLEYSGTFEVDIGANHQQVQSSRLHLKRSDGTELHL